LARFVAIAAIVDGAWGELHDRLQSTVERAAQTICCTMKRCADVSGHPTWLLRGHRVAPPPDKRKEMQRPRALYLEF